MIDEGVHGNSVGQIQENSRFVAMRALWGNALRLRVDYGVFQPSEEPIPESVEGLR